MKQRKRNAPVTLWGSGTPMRVLFVDDIAVVFALENKLPDYLYNVAGEDLTIRQLARTSKKITGHQGEIIWMLQNQMVRLEINGHI
jgi:GDP-L-fucose synthase